MAKEVSDKVRAITRAARKAALAAGKTWKTLPQEERKKYRQQAAAESRTSGAGNETQSPNAAARERAKRAAEQAGEKWTALTRERRQEYIRRARQSS